MKKKQADKNTITSFHNPNSEMQKIHDKMLEKAYKADMAEISASILHNIGNITTSIIISMEKIEELIRNSKMQNLLKANTLIQENRDNLVEYLTRDNRGKLLPQYYLKIGASLAEEQGLLKQELQNLSEKTAMIRDVITTQQEYVYPNLYFDDLYLINIIEDALKIEKSILYKAGIDVKTTFPEAESIIISAQKSKLIDIFINLFRNACDALQETEGDRILEIQVKSDDKQVYATVIDNGRGIQKADLEKIFDFGFTTRQEGFGFGLHSCAIFMQDMNGSITAESAGPGKGAAFKLIFPRRC